MRVRLALLLVAVGGTTSACAVDAAAADSCSGKERLCSHLVVPLDRAGEVPGTVRLHIERVRARRAARPPLFLIAGGPGQSATRAHRSGSEGDLIGTEIRSRDVVVMDLRGTGSSGVLRCADLERARARDQANAAERCAAELGARRSFFTADESADDIEAVRQSLGVPKIALLGTSYGTHVALAYARRYPANVDRLVLDSTIGPDGLDPLYAAGMRAAPRVLRHLCGKRRCAGFTRDAVADLAELAARLERRPLHGRVVDDNGRVRRASIDGFGLFTVLVTGDVDPLLRFTLPGAVRNALHGDPAPLLRAYRTAIEVESHRGHPRRFSVAAYAAALCEETRFPWRPGAPVAARTSDARAFVTAQPAGWFGPFGPSAPLGSDFLDLCARWPTPRDSSSATGKLPDVPALLLAGGGDLRTPVENARALAARLPQAQLMVVPGAGHDVLSSDFDGCATGGLRRFLAGGQAGNCKGEAVAGVLPPWPISFRGLEAPRKLPGRRGRTVTAVAWTVVDSFVAFADEFWVRLLIGDWRPADSLRAGGLRGGVTVFAPRRNALLLRRVSVVDGVHVSGRIELMNEGPGLATGRLRVSGNAASEGILRLRGNAVRGRLGGRRVRVGLGYVGESGSANRAFTISSSPQARLARRLSRLR